MMTEALEVVEERVVSEEIWLIERIGRITEIVYKDNSVRWRVELQDVNRKFPFVVEQFKMPHSAQDFLKKVRAQSEVLEEEDEDS